MRNILHLDTRGNNLYNKETLNLLAACGCETFKQIDEAENVAKIPLQVELNQFVGGRKLAAL